MKRSDCMTAADKAASSIFAFIKRHSVLFTAFCCVLLHFAFYGSAESANITLLEISAVIIAAVTAFFALKCSGFYRLLFCASFFFATLIFAILLMCGFSLFNFTLVFLAYISVVLYLLYNYKMLNVSTAAFLLIVLGFAVRLAYVLYTDCTVRQHDVEQFGSGIGHAGYIEYIYDNLRLPDFDVREVWQFYHPPLHHIAAALFLRVGVLLGGNYAECCESIQTLTLFYSGVAVIFCAKLLKQLKIQGNGYLAGVAFCALSPVLTVLSGSINNDMLSVAFSISAVYFAALWYNSQKLSHLLLCGLLIGLGMFTKLSVWMVAPGIAVMFLLVIKRDISKKKLSYFVGQFSAFALVTVPTGLFWTVRNSVRFGVPATYVPSLGNDSFQYIGDYSVVERLFKFPNDFLTEPFMAWGEKYYEYNPTVGLLRTALFGERINDGDYPQISVTARIFYIFGIFLTIACVIAFVRFFSKKCDLPQAPKVMLCVTALVTLIMYYCFCFAFPYTCTQNVRYAAVLVPVFGVALGYAVNTGGKHLKRLSNIALCGFCVFDVITYISLAI